MFVRMYIKSIYYEYSRHIGIYYFADIYYLLAFCLRLFLNYYTEYNDNMPPSNPRSPYPPRRRKYYTKTFNRFFIHEAIH